MRSPYAPDFILPVLFAGEQRFGHWGFSAFTFLGIKGSMARSIAGIRHNVGDSFDLGHRNIIAM